jgi:hypothetical protein
MARPRPHVLISPAFVLGLALLLVNDFVLKEAWPGFVTGKLSDFAGLWVFALFWSALLPRHASRVHLLTAAAWVLWKSPAAQPAIDALNATLPLQIARVVDYGDLAALVVLPASYACFVRLGDNAPGTPRVLLRRSAAALVLVVTLFAFGATSDYDDYGTQREDGVWYFADGPRAVITRLNELELDYNGEKFDPNGDFNCDPYSCYGSAEYWISVPSDFCGTHFKARIDFSAQYSGGTRAQLERIDHDCHRDRADILKLQRIVEREIIEPLGGFATPSDSRYSWIRTPSAGTSRGFTSPPGGAEGELTPLPTGARNVVIYDELASGSVTYEFDATASEVIERINDLGLEAGGVQFAPEHPNGARVLTMQLTSSVCPPTVTSRVLVRELSPDRAEVFLLEVQYTCPPLPGDRALFQAEFERTFVELLRGP